MFRNICTAEEFLLLWVMWRAGSEKWPRKVSGAFEISLGQGIFLVGRGVREDTFCEQSV